ncbi:signal peptide peptidase-like protein [Achlya hypogyna]|uniref:Signal peptide peptidase-like protein n=1 Tax=Achlya hypogyna TaxID=1202772 RepID=A0A1V9ZKJ2_ACHHY|nr:signal peptide peptidase-like protein [Achlya hypogyna]
MLLTRALAALAIAGTAWGQSGDTNQLQTAAVATSSDTFYGTYSHDPLGPGQWGGDLPAEDKALKTPVVSLAAVTGINDPYGCNSSALAASASLQQHLATYTNTKTPFTIMLLRGVCTFTDKALTAQKLGAVAVLVADSAEAIYNSSVKVNATKFDKMDAYDCAKGSATLTTLASPPWSEANNDPSCAATCGSRRCIPSGVGNQVCCMWDEADYMGAGVGYDQVTIPVVRVRAEDAAKISDGASISIFKRHIPKVDLAQGLIWAMAVATIIVAGYQASALERRKAVVRAAPVTTATVAVVAQLRQEQAEEPAMDINWTHAIGFLVFGSAFLLLLFYVNVVMIVIVMYCFGANSATCTILFSPLFERVKALRKALCRFETKALGDIRISGADVLALACSLTLVLLWVLSRRNPLAWILQDVFGVCVCILFLQTIRLPNIKVAVVLLVLVFLYDIFFVFISPYIFGKSVMIVAAQGGKQDDSKAPTAYCLRYPRDTDYGCIKEEIPILLRLPKVTNWLGGQAMLGLGDIVLPGLLLVFTARYDYATRGNVCGAPTKASPAAYPGRLGLFGIMCIGYAIGLALANVGVILMQSGQPALLYLVPCTLGVLCLITWRHGLLRNLWVGPKEFGAMPSVEAEPEGGYAKAEPTPTVV